MTDKLNDKALEAARKAVGTIPGAALWNEVERAIRAYLSASTPAPDDGLVERLDSHMGLADMGKVLEDCRLAASALRTQAETIARLERERDEAQDYLRNFMTIFVREHFPNNSEWEPLPDLLGMLTQMDNASTVARDYVAKVKAAKARLARAVEALRRIEKDEVHTAFGAKPTRGSEIARSARQFIEGEK